jgi:hypothetical protein
VEGEARMPVKPGAQLGVFVGGANDEDHVHRLVGWHARADRHRSNNIVKLLGKLWDHSTA